MTNTFMGNNQGLELTSMPNNNYGYTPYGQTTFGGGAQAMQPFNAGMGPQGNFMQSDFGNGQSQGFNLADVSGLSNDQQSAFEFDVGNMGANANAGGDPSFMQKWFTGSTDANGNQSAGIASTLGGLAMSGMSAWQGMQMLDMAKDRFKYQKGFAEREYTDRKAAYDEQLADRAKARNAAKGG